MPPSGTLGGYLCHNPRDNSAMMPHRTIHPTLTDSPRRYGSQPVATRPVSREVRASFLYAKCSHVTPAWVAYAGRRQDANTVRLFLSETGFFFFSATSRVDCDSLGNMCGCPLLVYCGASGGPCKSVTAEEAGGGRVSGGRPSKWWADE